MKDEVNSGLMLKHHIEELIEHFGSAEELSKALQKRGFRRKVDKLRAEKIKNQNHDKTIFEPVHECDGFLPNISDDLANLDENHWQ